MKFLSKIGLFALFCSAVVGCKPDKEDEMPPVDGKPAIRRISPANATDPYIAGDAVVFSYSLADNELISKFKMVAKVDQEPDSVLTDIAVSGTVSNQSYTYIVPPKIDLTRITIWAYVYDNKNQVDSISYVITKDFVRDTTELYSLLSYSSDTIYSGLSLTGQSAFNLTARTNITGTVTARDISEISNMSGSFLAEFNSPNNGTNAAPFVVLNTSIFNFDEARYSTISRAYDGNVHTKQTGTLAVNDVVILKLIQQPHYAVLRITAIVDNPGDEDYIVFDYKRSQ